MPLTPVSRSQCHPHAEPAYPVLLGVALVVAWVASPPLGPHAQAQALCHVPGDYATIQLAAGTHSEALAIARSLTLQGDGPATTRLDGGGSGAVVTITGGVVTITGVTIQGGAAEEGGGIVKQGTLTLANSTLAENAAVFGGGIFNVRTLTVTNSTLAENSAGIGGGIANAGGVVRLRQVTFQHNTPNDCAGCP